VPLLIPQTELSSRSHGILNLECAVCPPGKRSDATPEEATVRTIFLCSKMVDYTLLKVGFSCSSIANDKVEAWLIGEHCIHYSGESSELVRI
jgi:hypothetical protein